MKTILKEGKYADGEKVLRAKIDRKAGLFRSITDNGNYSGYF